MTDKERTQKLKALAAHGRKFTPEEARQHLRDKWDHTMELLAQSGGEPPFILHKGTPRPRPTHGRGECLYCGCRLERIPLSMCAQVRASVFVDGELTGDRTRPPGYIVLCPTAGCEQWVHVMVMGREGE